MTNAKKLLASAIAVFLMTHTAGALDLNVPVGGDIQKAIDRVSSAGGGEHGQYADYVVSTSLLSSSGMTVS